MIYPDGSSTTVHFNDAWCACLYCHDMIETGDEVGAIFYLAKKNAKLAGKSEPDSFDLLAVEKIFPAFLEHRTGPPVLVPFHPL